MPPLPNHLLAERDALIADIHAAFKNVRRGRGTSWAETYVLDYYGEDHERLAQERADDPERPWPELASEFSWFFGGSGWSFLDPEGFRFYLPPAMIREIGSNDSRSVTALDFHLLLSRTEPEFSFEKWSLLDDHQRRCVKRFLEHMVARTQASGYENFASDWLTALNSYWASIPEA